MNIIISHGIWYTYTALLLLRLLCVLPLYTHNGDDDDDDDDDDDNNKYVHEC